MAGWLRRNAVALVALAVLVPASIWALDTVEFGSVRNAERTVPAGSDASVGDWTFAVPRLESVSPEEVGAPDRSDPVIVRVPVTPGTADVMCTPPVVIDPATGREWAPSPSLDWMSSDDEHNYCPSPEDDSSAFDLAAIVLLPGDAPDRLLVQFGAGLGDDVVLTDLRFDISR